MYKYFRYDALGLLFLLGLPAAILISFVTIVAIPVGILVAIAYVTLILLGTVLVSILIANWLNNTYVKSWSYRRMILAAFGIFIYLKLASLTPVIGPAIMFLLVCMSFGGILMSVKWKRDAKLAMT